MKSWCWVALVVAAGFLQGCANDYWPLIDPKPSTGNMKTEISAPKTVNLSVGQAWYWNNDVTVIGMARPSTLAGKESVDGFIDVELLDKNNNVVATAMASLDPSTLDADHPSLYKLSLWAKTPCDNHLKIVFIDQRDEAAYLGNVGGGAPGAAGQSGNYSRGSGGGAEGGTGSSFNGFGHGVSGVSGVSGVTGVGYR